MRLPQFLQKLRKDGKKSGLSFK